MQGAKQSSSSDEETAAIIEVLSEFERGNFTARVESLPSKSSLAAIASKVNAIGSTLQRQRQTPTAPSRSADEQLNSGISLVAKDVTERSHAVLTEQQFVDVLRLMPIGINITRGSDGRILDANDAYCRIFGYSREDLIGRTALELEMWCRSEQRLAILDDLRSLGRLSNVELHLRHKSGSTVVVLGTLLSFGSADDTYLVSMVVDITERYQTAQSLEASQRTLQAALDSMTDAVFISDADGHFIEFNEAFATFHRFNSKIECAKTLDQYPAFLEVYHADGSLAALEEWVVPRALRGERVSDAEYLLRRKDTGESWVGNYSFGPIRNASGAIIGSVVVGRDVTELKRTEEALRASEARYRLVSENGSDVIWLFDLAANRFSYVSPSVEKLRGYSVAEVLHQSMADALTPESLQMVVSQLPMRLAAFSSGDESMRTQTHEVEQTRKGGSIVSAEVVTTLITDAQGSITHIQGVSRDITVRKAAQQALRASEERFRSLVDAAPDAIFIQIDGCFSYVNPAAIRLYGATCAEDLIGQAVVSRIHPDYRDLARTRIHRLNVEREAQAAVEQVFLTLSGESKAVDVRGVPFRHLGQHGALVFARDISARKRAEADREATHAQLLHAQKMESIGRLAGGVAHDFNNLLAVILSYADFLIEQLPANSPMRGDLVEIYRSGERAKALTRQLLAFSRQQVLQPEVLSVNDVADGVVRMLGSIIGEDVRLTLHLTRDLGHVKIDRGQLEQILMNLATNARDAMPEGGELTIETASLRLDEHDVVAWPSLSPGSYVLLSVADNGSGISESVRTRIFEPFFTTKPLGKGTGLGLSTVYGIVKQSGGAISVESAPGRGTCMKILLPVTQEALTQHGPGQPMRFPTSGNQTVLVVEDSEPLRKMVIRVLGAKGYRVLEVPNAVEALQVCAEHLGTIHLLVTDVVMPTMNGPQLAERVRELQPNIRVLFMSGYADEMLGDCAVQSGINFIAKPFGAAELRQKVGDVLDGS